MALVNMVGMLTKAKEGKYAVGQFNINNLEWTRRILETAQKNNAPVILGVSEGAAKYMGGFNVVTATISGILSGLLFVVVQKSADFCKKHNIFSHKPKSLCYNKRAISSQSLILAHFIY